MTTENVTAAETISTSVPASTENRALRSELLGLFATGLLMSFFLPWAQFLGAKLSGFEIQRLGDEQRLLWLIPILSAITIFAALTRKGQQLAGQLAGLTPFLAAGFWYTKLGNDLFQIVMYGGYLCLFFGACLMLVARNLK